MSIFISSTDVKRHIEKVISLLKQQEYTPQATVLTREERLKLFNFFYSYSQNGVPNNNFESPFHLRTEEELEKQNQKLFENMDDEIRAIITKCNADPKKVYLLNNKYGETDSRISYSMESRGIAKIGEYTIEFGLVHPIERNSIQIQNFREEFQQEKYERYKNGESVFKVSKEINGEKKIVYYHSEDMQFGGYISFMDEQIGGNFGIKGHQISLATGLMKKEEGIARCINKLMPFFRSFEKLLSNQIKENAKGIKSTFPSQQQGSYQPTAIPQGLGSTQNDFIDENPDIIR